MPSIFGDEETMENCEPAYDFEKTQSFLSSFCIARKGAVAAVHRKTNKMIGYILFNEYQEDIYEMGWIFNRSFCAKWILKLAEAEDLTINLRHLMDFGEGAFDICILNTNQIVHSMKELVPIAGLYV